MHWRFGLALISLLFVWPLGVSAMALVELKTGFTRSEQELLSEGRLLVFVERSCAACDRQAQTLRSCDEEKASDFLFVSTDTPATVRAEARRNPDSAPKWVLKNRSLFPDLKGTPTLRWKNKSHLGALTCVELSEWMREDG